MKRQKALSGFLKSPMTTRSASSMKVKSLLFSYNFDMYKLSWLARGYTALVA